MSKAQINFHPPEWQWYIIVDVDIILYMGNDHVINSDSPSLPLAAHKLQNAIITYWDGHQMYNQGYNVYTHTSHTDFSTDLSWDGQSLILWQQWRREGVGRGWLEGREDRVIKYCREVEYTCTYTAPFQFTQQQLRYYFETHISVPHVLHAHVS